MPGTNPEIIDGFIGGLTITSSGMWYGQGQFANANTGFYIAKNGVTLLPNFSLGDKLQWNGTSLEVRGDLRLADGTLAINSNTARSEAEGTIQNGFIGGLTITSTKMHYGAGNFANADTAFYVGKNQSNQANFSLGNKLTWDGTTLQIRGNLRLESGEDAIGENGTFGGMLDAAGGTFSGQVTVGGTRLGNLDGNHFGLALEENAFDNIFLKRSDGAVFFRAQGSNAALLFDTESGGTLDISGSNINFTLDSSESGWSWRTRMNSNEPFAIYGSLGSNWFGGTASASYLFQSNGFFIYNSDGGGMGLPGSEGSLQLFGSSVYSNGAMVINGR